MSDEEEARKKIVSAIEKGNFSLSKMGEKYFEDGKTLDFSGETKFDFTVTDVELTTGPDGFTIAWASKSAGFGNLTFFFKKGKLNMDTEGLGKDFAKEVLAKLVDVAEVDDGR